ncbi:hypothetical protein K5Q02_18780 [Pseudomonas sp. MM211]|uniref:hypothetical protein n=1 Tax=Pseudomonas sp. MM211 TaxID=2866808 RepID=UPI001CEC3874|nr:hypothetical protein [Pseudomonas sp. MM211]UCJ15858.1 hypothetical protein K5Q02_18780 [Pseudomonas sp. MM211]
MERVSTSAAAYALKKIHTYIFGSACLRPFIFPDQRSNGVDLFICYTAAPGSHDQLGNELGNRLLHLGIDKNVCSVWADEALLHRQVARSFNRLFSKNLDDAVHIVSAG